MVSSGKVLCVGLGDLVSARNSALRAAGFEVIAALSLEEVFQLFASGHFDVAIVGHGFSVREKAEFVSCFRSVFRLPVILISEGQRLLSLQADSQIGVEASTDELISAIDRLMDGEESVAAAS